MNIRSVALLGAGAVGSYFIWGMKKLPDIDFCIIAKGERKERLERDGLLINGICFRPRIAEPEQVAGADLLIVASKYDGLLSALDDIAVAAADGHTTVMSVMNGVDSEELIAEKIGEQAVLPALIKIASRRANGEVRFDPDTTYGVVFGEASSPEVSPRMQAIGNLFDAAGIRYSMSDHIMKEIWEKYAFNVSYNLPQAIIGCGIGAYLDSTHAAWLKQTLRDEVAAVAFAKGIDIRELSPLEQIEHPSPPPARYSTLQDLDAGRHTEVDMFAGTLVRMGKERGVPTPATEFAWHAIKALEEKNDGKFDY